VAIFDTPTILGMLLPGWPADRFLFLACYLPVLQVGPGAGSGEAGSLNRASSLRSLGHASAAIVATCALAILCLQLFPAGREPRERQDPRVVFLAGSLSRVVTHAAGKSSAVGGTGYLGFSFLL